MRTFKAYNREHVVEALERYIFDNHRTKTEAARKWGIDKSYLSSMLVGRRPISAKILKKIGYKKIVQLDEYMKVKK